MCARNWITDDLAFLPCTKCGGGGARRSRVTEGAHSVAMREFPAIRGNIREIKKACCNAHAFERDAARPCAILALRAWIITGNNREFLVCVRRFWSAVNEGLSPTSPLRGGRNRVSDFGWGPHPTCSLRCARRPPRKGEVGRSVGIRPSPKFDLGLLVSVAFPPIRPTARRQFLG